MLKNGGNFIEQQLPFVWCVEATSVSELYWDTSDLAPSNIYPLEL